ncbi:MAG TPA: HEPN domain-containing protein [Chitinophagaceae bacterium]
MKTSLEHLPAEKQLLVKDIVKTIVEKINPEKVILFGSHATGKWQEHEYKEEGRWFEYRSDYDILVITREGDRRSDYEVQDIAEYRSGLRDIISVITHDITYINGKLSDGQYFFSDIQKEGVLLYDAGITPLATRRELTDPEKKSMAADDFELWFENGQEFLIDGINAAGRHKYKKAAFELHQAAECFYNAIILVFRGYKPKTHNLEKLYRYTKHYSVALAGIFPQHTPEEKNLFILLKKGYVEARYDRKYVIKGEDVDILIARVSRLQERTEDICREKIASFGTGE